MKKTSSFRRINDWVHLWLGLISGIVVFIVSLTGCIYVFQQEVNDALEPWRFVEIQDESFVPPSHLLDTAQKYMSGKQPTGLTYSNKEGAAAVGFATNESGERSFSVVFMNPYTGSYLTQHKTVGEGSFNFFRFIIDGHRALWLPYKIGRPIVGICTLVFVILLVTGMVMWWPEKWNRTNIQKSFKVKWKASFKRVNYDLHNVLGFYSLLFAMIIALTGLVWSFEWFSRSVYFLTSGGETKEVHAHPHSNPDSQRQLADSVSLLDLAWYRTLELDDNIEGAYIHPQVEGDEAVEVVIYHDHGSFFDRNIYYFDQYSMELIRTEDDRFSEADFADQLSMLNYDMHIGAALGLPGKILAFLASLICTSLPVTGFFVWWNRKKKVKKQQQKTNPSDSLKQEEEVIASV